VNDCLISTKFTIARGDRLTTYELEEFETGVKIPKGTFDLPEELRKSVRIAEQAK
jgi:hypothetical protein